MPARFLKEDPLGAAEKAGETASSTIKSRCCSADRTFLVIVLTRMTWWNISYRSPSPMVSISFGIFDCLNDLRNLRPR